MIRMLEALLADKDGATYLPMRLPYGQRYNETSQKLDAPQAKSFGFFGPLLLPSGEIASEYSSSALINGKNVDYPLIAQNMPHQLLAKALMAAQLHVQPPSDVAEFAYKSAVDRVKQGRSPFLEIGRDQFPSWSPQQYWPEAR